MDAKHLGSDFDDFLREEGLLDEAEAVASKRVLACQVSEASGELFRIVSASRATRAERKSYEE